MREEISAGGIVFRKFEILASRRSGRNSKFETKWLICQHSQHKGWVFPKGLIGDVNDAESIEEAAIREVKEEGGVMAKIIAPLPRPQQYFYKFEGELIKKTVYYFLMEYLSGDPADHDWEMMDAKFVSEEEVLSTLDFKSDKEAFKMALELI